jgi:Leucine-rich repeat (LRR) protein
MIDSNMAWTICNSEACTQGSLCENHMNVYGKYKVLDLLGRPKSSDKVVRRIYPDIDIAKFTALQLDRIGIKDLEAESLAKLNLELLNKLDLYGNSITARGARALSKGNLTSLTTLSLSRNKLGVGGARALSQGNLTSLTTLNLSENKIGVEGARALSHGNLASLTTLDLSSNKI